MGADTKCARTLGVGCEGSGWFGEAGATGDIDKERILRAAETLLEENGVVEGISLRGLAAELGGATNTIYTYL